MSITTHRIFTVVLVIAAIAAPIYGSIPRKLDDTPVTVTPGAETKCGGCSTCQNPCYQSPPPPPPPVLPPPPPPPSPPPSPKKPSPPYCPPPPSRPSGPSPPSPPSGLIYITGPPGELYPVDRYYNGASRSFAVGRPILIACGLLGVLALLLVS